LGAVSLTRGRPAKNVEHLAREAKHSGVDYFKMLFGRTGFRQDCLSAKREMKPLADTIAEHPFLRGMQTLHLDVLAECAMPTEFARDTLIFRQGDLANRFYLIQTGRVVLESEAPNGEKVLVETLGDGDALGWSWLFPPYYWNFDARAVQPTTAIFFYGTRLRTQCDEDRGFGFELVRRMAMVAIRRLQATRNQLLSMHITPTTARGPKPH
jgi:CRP-like cAMP-binding protein